MRLARFLMDWGTMTDEGNHKGEGSRWYFPVFEGLFSAEHREAMGPALWLYGWILARAWVAQSNGSIHYTHIEAARDLGTSERTVGRWFSQLQENGYVQTRARGRYELDVQVTKWRTVEEWLNSRDRDGRFRRTALGSTAGRSDISVQSGASEGNESGQNCLVSKGEGGAEWTELSSLTPEPVPRVDKNVHSDAQGGHETRHETGQNCPPSITIRLSRYEYPTGPLVAAHGLGSVCLADAFEHLLARLRVEPNRPAILREIYRLCFGGEGDDLPDYGYIGRVAKRLGGAGLLAKRMWELTVDRPAGDVLAYILAAHERNKGERKNGATATREFNEQVTAALRKNWQEG